MITDKIAPYVYAISLGIVNAFLLDAPGELTLIDSGLPDNEEKILSAIRELGRSPADLKHILLTHTHGDHIGSAAALRRATGAKTYMHPLDVAIANRGSGFRRLKPSPGPLNWLLVTMMGRKMRTMVAPGVAIDVQVEDGTELPIAGGITVVHTPGHCLGQVGYLWPQHGGVLFIGDACGNVLGLDWSIGYEDIVEGERSLNKLATYSYETACFGHGKAIQQNASRQIWNSWHAPEPMPREGNV